MAMNVYLIHGLMGTGEIHFKEQLGPLREEFTVIPIDLPGHGQNSRDADDPFFEQTLEWLISELRKREPGILIGLSMGASFALHAAIRYPELTKGIVLTGYVPSIPEDMHAIMERQYHFLHNIKAEAPEVAKDYLLLHGPRWDTTLHKVVKCFTYHYPAVSDDQIKKLTIPTLLINGGNEKHEVDSVHHLSSLNNLITPRIIPNCGHLANMENPLMFNRMTLEFISSIAEVN
ncbi:alpha/beta hydrolase [Rossellomorea sp. DA94]|uniref:alpha/beta fold hydrolase n=1 Tax=Rossellomorea sp. DA94 TaxID=3038653 RepID=UPI002449E943|nr:alpha/beta hydrolase [Rossellomorea sp. DA94]WGG46461.1 alpha/beta hydrolase [Rossellomorea sp. DA94]